MDREDIIRMAREAGAMFDHLTWVERDLAPVFDRFAALVAEQERKRWHKAGARAIRMAINIEREACAQIADVAEPYQAADLIRARGNT